MGGVRGIGTKREGQTHPKRRARSLARIAGHALSNICLDVVAGEVERVRGINQTLSLVPPEARGGSALRTIELLVIAPSQRLDAIAARHVGELPPAVRPMLGGVGVSSSAADIKGAALASYLLFEAGYTRELMALGYADARRQQGEICKFFDWSPAITTAEPVSEPPGEERRLDPLRLP